MNTVQQSLYKKSNVYANIFKGIYSKHLMSLQKNQT